MTQLQHLDAEIHLETRCGNCRHFPGNNQLCEERGRPVQRITPSKRYCYEAMSPGEYKAYREAHKDEVSAKKKAWYEAHKDEASAKMKAWYEAHKDEVSAKRKAWYEAHKDEVSAKRKAEKTRVKQALNALEKLKTTNPELYEKILQEAKP